MVAHTLVVFEGPGAEVEAHLDQVGEVKDLWIGGGVSYSHNGMENANGG